MATQVSTDANHDAPTRSFYLPALASGSAEPGAIERLVSRLYEGHRRNLRRMEWRGEDTATTDAR